MWWPWPSGRSGQACPRPLLHVLIPSQTQVPLTLTGCEVLSKTGVVGGGTGGFPGFDCHRVPKAERAQMTFSGSGPASLRARPGHGPLRARHCSCHGPSGPTTCLSLCTAGRFWARSRCPWAVSVGSVHTGGLPQPHGHTAWGKGPLQAFILLAYLSRGFSLPRTLRSPSMALSFPCP